MIYSAYKGKLFKNFIVLSKLFCHQIPERTFKIKGRYLPVCSRCTGLYLGILSFCLYAYYNYINYSILLMFIAILAIVPTFLDGFTQLIGLRMSTNTIRFVTGIFGGIGIIMLLASIKVIFL